jgi:hypothetical protein
MDNVAQRQIDVWFYSGQKSIKNIPWKVKLQPNIYGGEGKDFYFLKVKCKSFSYIFYNCMICSSYGYTNLELDIKSTKLLQNS